MGIDLTRVFHTGCWLGWARSPPVQSLRSHPPPFPLLTTTLATSVATGPPWTPSVCFAHAACFVASVHVQGHRAKSPFIASAGPRYAQDSAAVSPCSVFAGPLSAKTPLPTHVEAFRSPHVPPKTPPPTRLASFLQDHVLLKTRLTARPAAFPSATLRFKTRTTTRAAACPSATFMFKVSPPNRLPILRSRRGRWRSSWLEFQATHRLPIANLEHLGSDHPSSFVEPDFVSDPEPLRRRHRWKPPDTHGLQFRPPYSRYRQSKTVNTSPKLTYSLGQPPDASPTSEYRP